MKLSLEDMRLLAQRARLALTDRELEEYARDLEALEQLSEALLPYAGTALEEHDGQRLADMRQDAVKDSLSADTVTGLAPVCEGAYISVPCAVKE